MKNKKGFRIELILGVIVILGILMVVLYYGIGKKDHDTKMLELSELQNYKNFDDTYASMKQLLFEDMQTNIVYTVSLSMDGKVYTGNYSSRKYINGITNAVDIISYSDGPGGIDVYKCYILLDNGDVYLYSMSDMFYNKYTALKVDKVKNVDRLINFRYGPTENAGGLWGILAVTKDGKYIELAKSGV